MSCERRFKFTEKKLLALSDHPVDTKVRFYDTQIDGLVVIQQPSGALTYSVYKKPRGAKSPVTVQMGKVGTVALFHAREQAQEHISVILKGGNPNLMMRERNQNGLTLQKALDEYCELRKDKVQPQTLKQYQAAILNYSPLLLKKKIKDITFEDVIEVHKKISNGRCSWVKANGKRHSMKKPSPSQANLWGRAMRAVINYAMDNWRGADRRQLISENPMRALSVNRQWNKVKPKTTRIHDSQLECFFNTLQQFRSDVSHSPSEIAISYALEIALFTGLREMEILTLTKGQVDFKEGVFYLPNTKNGDSLVLPLTPHLEVLLLTRYEFVPDDCDFLFPSITNKSKHICDPRKTINNLKVLSANNGQEALNLNFHDLRRTFASLAETCNVGKYMIKRLMNHRSSSGGDVTGDYMHFSHQDILKKSTEIERYILKQGRQLTSDDSESLNEELRRMLDQLDDDAKRNWLALMTK
ncbi:tyrosine-type recombinase/integrase [Vibrio sp. DNB22_19_2]